MPVSRDALFTAAANWLRARGRDEIMGPIDYSTNYVCGLLIEGFEHPPMILTSHNRPYYERLVEGWGFAKAIDFYAWWIGDPERAAKRLRRIAAARKNRQAFTIRRSTSGICRRECAHPRTFTTKRGRTTGALSRSRPRNSTTWRTR